MSKINFLILIVVLGNLSCLSEKEPSTDTKQIERSTPAVFDQEKWLTKEGEDYPFRASMIHDVLYNDTVRSLEKAEIISLLGKPDRANDGHLYYMVSQKRLGSWPLHTQTLVIKFNSENKIEWIKIHK